MVSARTVSIRSATGASSLPGGRITEIGEPTQATATSRAGLPGATFTTQLRLDNEPPAITDGPYAETKEQMGGFWVIEAADLDVALEWAGKCAAACEGPVELRPMQVDG